MSRACKQVRLGGMVIAGFDCGLALLLELAGVEELLAFDGIGGAAVAHVRELERHLPFRLDQVGRRRRPSPGGLEGKCQTGQSPPEVAWVFSSKRNCYRSDPEFPASKMESMQTVRAGAGWRGGADSRRFRSA